MTYSQEEILFAMFILKANHVNYKGMICQYDRGEQICTVASIIYADLFSDRGIAEEEREFKVIERDYCDEGRIHRSKLILEHESPLGPVVYEGDIVTIRVER